MNFFFLETYKILNKRFTCVLLLVTTFVFPALIKVISHLSAVQNEVPEGMFANHVAFGIISYIQLYLFLPVWIIIFVGLELSNGHANRVVFATSRQFYFTSKIYYCILISVFFTIVGSSSLCIALKTSPYSDLYVASGLYISFSLQLFIATLTYSILLLALVFLVRSPIITFVVYFGWTFIEGIMFSLFRGIYKIDAWWMPLHLVRTIFTRNGHLKSDQYYNPLVDDIPQLIFPIAFAIILVFFTRYIFLKSDLKPLSD